MNSKVTIYYENGKAVGWASGEHPLTENTKVVEYNSPEHLELVNKIKNFIKESQT